MEPLASAALDLRYLSITTPSPSVASTASLELEIVKSVTSLIVQRISPFFTSIPWFSDAGLSAAAY
nr:MAG TPA: hypothetical protein [Caudoviricetes sp.]